MPFLVFAYSDNTERCMDRVYGVIFGFRDYDIGSRMEQDIASFCLRTNSQVDYSELTELAQASRDVVEDFSARSLLAVDLINDLGEPLFESNDFDLSLQSQIIGSLDDYYDTVRSIYASAEQVLSPLIDDGYTFAEEDLSNVEYQLQDFYSEYNTIKAAVNNNYVCHNGDFDDPNAQNCECFEGYAWNSTYTQCLESDADEVDSSSQDSEESIFTDVDAGDSNSVAISYLKDNGIVGGYSDGSFKPTNPLNRAELLKILVEGKGYTPDAAFYKSCFPDVNTEWFARYVCYAKENGWIEGYPDNTFKPANNVNKAEAIKMLLEVFGQATDEPSTAPYMDVALGQWFTKYIDTARSLGLLEESGDYYYPSYNITRGGISENIYRVLTL